MPLLLDETSIDKGPLSTLAKLLSQDREAYLQLLLDISRKTTFNRIVRCPTYPVRTVTMDLEERTGLFRKGVAPNPYDISFALAFLYEASEEMERRKNNGQYFTPPYVAKKATVCLDLRPGQTLLDPGCGTGIFPLTLLKGLEEKAEDPASFGYLGVETDPLLALSTAVSLDWVGAPESWQVLFSNYLKVGAAEIKRIIGEKKEINAIISNPPFVRFHRLGERAELATELRLPRFSGLHSFFLAHSLRLARGSRMLFILPLEMNGTRYGATQLGQLRSMFRLENEIIYRDERRHEWKSLKSHEISLDMHTSIRHAWNLILFKPLSRVETEPPIPSRIGNMEKTTVCMNSFANVHRGISTGANSFFVINDELAKDLGVLDKTTYLKKIMPTKIAKERIKVVFDHDDWQSLRNEGKSCWLLSLPAKTAENDLPSRIRQYLREGERLGVHRTPTCMNRKPWYSIRIPQAPDLFFTYISRGFPKFAYNKAQVHNLTNLLGVYLKSPAAPFDYHMQELAELLNVELADWINRKAVGRMYKGGIIKFEPRDLEKMPVSSTALCKIDMRIKRWFTS